MKQKSEYVKDEVGKQYAKEKQTRMRENQNEDKGMEDCCEFSEGLSFCIRRLSWVSRSKELSLLESMEKLSKDAVCPVLQICSLMEEVP